MKVLQLGKFYPIRGGVEKVMWDLTENLSKRGVYCDMLCANYDPRSRSQEIRFNDFGRVIVLPTSFQASGTMICPKMVSWLRDHCREYDIIHVHHPDPMACLALRLSGYEGRVILHWHSDILKNKVVLAMYEPLQSWLIGRADTIVGTTPVYVAQSKALSRVQGKVTYVPIGIEPVQYDEAKAEELRGKYSGKKIVFSLGRLVPYKGFKYLIKAAEYLPEDYMVLIGGTGPLKDDLQNEINSLNLGGKVELLGFVPDEVLPALYGASDIFVMSSVMKTEAFGIVQIEAMSCGKPIVATNIPESGVSWVNSNGESGLNVAPEDPEALAVAIKSICDDNAVYNKYSKGAKNRFFTTFTISNMIDKILNIYEG
ncbi:MAG: glycosyltransferase [Bacteroidales bacterium]|nr:glycosyltransferase [Bacteroidales bacterium]